MIQKQNQKKYSEKAKVVHISTKEQWVELGERDNYLRKLNKYRKN